MRWLPGFENAGKLPATISYWFVSFCFILGFSLAMAACTPPQEEISTPFPAEIVDIEGIPMRLVPAGEFMMGSDQDSDNLNASHRVTLEEFYFDKYEVTNVRYGKCVTAGVCEPPHFTKSDYRPLY